LLVGAKKSHVCMLRCSSVEEEESMFSCHLICFKSFVKLLNTDDLDF
jgi:hypothetical protein